MPIVPSPLKLLVIAAVVSTGCSAACLSRSDGKVNDRLSYVRTLLASAAVVDSKANEPEASMDGFERLTNQMVSFKEFAANLACARDAVHPFTSSSDQGIATAAANLEKLYQNQILLVDEALALMRDDNRSLTGALADQISTLRLKSSGFWSDLVTAIAVDAPGLLFTDKRDEKGIRNELRITVPEHIALFTFLSKEPEFSYQNDSKPNSRGALAGFQIFEMILASRPLTHSDGKIFPLKKISFPDTAAQSLP